MIKVSVHNLQGKKTGDVSLEEKVFGVETNKDLVSQVYVCLESNKRRGLSHTKTRGDRAGSTRKPWKQKGTGRARTGSVRNPIWRKGGITFGPTKEQNFSKKINKKMSAKALCMALSEKIKEEKFVVVENFDLKEAKTKEFAQALKDLKLEKNVMVSFLPTEDKVSVSSRNIPFVKNMAVSQISVSDVLNSGWIMISKEGILSLQERLAGKKEEKKEEKVEEVEKKEVSNKKK